MKYTPFPKKLYIMINYMLHLMTIDNKLQKQ